MGDYALDELWKSYEKREKTRELLKTKYKLSKSKKITILALPQMAEHGYLDWETHFNYIHKIITSCLHSDSELLISLHPKMDTQKYAYLAEKFNCTILEERLFNVLAAADIFLSKASSVIRWGVMCNINVILFDFWNFDVDNYQYLNSIDIVLELEQLNTIFISRLNQPQDHSAVHDLLSRESLFDGKSMHRYAELIYKKSTQA